MLTYSVIADSETVVYAKAISITPQSGVIFQWLTLHTGYIHHQFKHSASQKTADVKFRKRLISILHEQGKRYNIFSQKLQKGEICKALNHNFFRLTERKDFGISLDSLASSSTNKNSWRSELGHITSRLCMCSLCTEHLYTHTSLPFAANEVHALQ